MNKRIKDILVAVNLSDKSYYTLEHASAIACSENATIHLLYIISYSPLSFFNNYNKSELLPFITDKHRNEIASELETWKWWFQKKADIKIITVIREGDTAKQIAEYASRWGIDLIIMGINKNRNFFTKLKESVVEKVAKTVSSPVMLVINNKYNTLQWNDIVLPVSEQVPEKSIKLLLDFTKKFQIKIHFVSLSDQVKRNQGKPFEALLESLKTVKSYSNIPVECINLHGNNLSKVIWNYANNIHANAIMIK